MKRYIKASFEYEYIDTLFKDAIKFKRDQGCKISIKNGGIEIYNDEDLGDIWADYAYVDDLKAYLEESLNSGYDYDSVVEFGLADYDNYEYITTARGHMSRSEFNRKRQLLRQKYLKVNSKNDKFEEALDILEEIFNVISDKPFDESLVTKKNKNKFILSGPKIPTGDKTYTGKTLLSAVNYNNVFLPEEIDQLNNYNFRLTWTGYIDLGSQNQHLAKRYNRKIKEYVLSILEKFNSDNYVLKLSSGTGNIELTFI